MKGPSLYTSPLPQKKKETKRGEDPDKKGTGLVVPKKNKYGVIKPKKTKRGENPHPNKGTGLVKTKKLTLEDRLTEQKKVDNPKRGTGLKI